MAYIQCKHCGAQMSDKSEACPMCGAPVEGAGNNEVVEPIHNEQPAKNPTTKWILLGVIGLIAIVAVILCIVLLPNRGDTIIDEAITETTATNHGIITNVFSLTEPKLLSTPQQHDFVCYSLRTINETPIEIEKDVDNDGKSESVKLHFDQVGWAVTMYKEIVEQWYGREFMLLDAEDVDDVAETFMQVSFIDLDGDNVQEIIVTAGNWITGIYAYIYKVRNADEDSFKQIGEFTSQETIILDDKHFICPYGSQGLFEEYIYDRGRIINVND